MATLTRINVTPVKGARLLHPDEVEIAERGIVGNRRFWLIDASGDLFSGSDHGPLATVAAGWDAESDRLRLEFPDGTVEEAPATPTGEATTTDFYGRPEPGHVVDGPFGGAWSRFVGRDLRLVRGDADGAGNDELPLTLVSSASVVDLARRGRLDAPLDSRRFRVNLEFDDCDPYEEDSWDGRAIGLGEAVVRIHGQIPRCVVTTQSPDTGEKDWDTLTQIAKYRPRIGATGGLPFGVYGVVLRSGRSALGDRVDVLD